jgi:hypothetical protein
MDQCCGSASGRIQNIWPDSIRNGNKRFGSGFGSGFESGTVVRSVVDPRLFGKDPDLRIRASYKWIRIRIRQIYAHLVRSQVTELREGSLFMFEDEAG